MPNPSQTNQWWVNDQTPDNPYGKSEDYEAFLDYLGALPRSLTPAIAAGTAADQRLRAQRPSRVQGRRDRRPADVGVRHPAAVRDRRQRALQ